MAEITAEKITSPQKKKKSLLRRLNPLLWLTVVFPTLFSAIYFGLFASDIYVSESSFVVRSPRNQSSLSGVGALLQGTGFARSQDDTYSVQEYMRSRTALEQLQNGLPVRDYYATKGDILSRFNGFGLNDTQEAFYRYFQDRLSVDVDAVSGIATLSVQAFEASEGQQLNQELLKLGEALINRLNERGRKDTIEFAKQAVQEAEENVSQTAMALSKYRIKNKIFDLPAQSGVQLSLISSLKSELIRVETQLAQLQSITPDNPQVDALLMRQKSLRKEIEEQSRQLSGNSGSSVANQTAEYQRLVLDNELAQQQLTASMTSLHNSRGEAERQQLYLEVISQPSKPDWALLPNRLYNIIATFIIGFMLYGIFGLLIASVREHKN